MSIPAIDEYANLMAHGRLNLWKMDAEHSRWTLLIW
jgi:hypothetical protein